MSTSYPRVHVVGSGAYYSYRPLTRFIEKVERNHYRDNSSKPKDFNQYLAATTSSRGDGYIRAPSHAKDTGDYGFSSSSFPPFGEAKSHTSKKGPSQTDKGERRNKLSEMKDDFDKELERDEEYLRLKELLRERRERYRDPEEDTIHRLRKKHPYRLPVEDEVVPPHESSIWPANRKHFDLVSSYDTMTDYLGISKKESKETVSRQQYQ